jgi:putative restriction endonuclease
MTASNLHARWLAKLTRLRPAPGRTETAGVAPHKPLLLLCLLDLADLGQLPPSLTRSASLVLRFRTYANLVSERWPGRLDIRLPLYHLKTQGLWAAFDADQRPARSSPTCVSIEFDPSFRAALSDPGFRLDARLLLTKRYFTSPERVALLEAMGLRDNWNVREQTEEILADAYEAAKRKGRSAKFQIGVVDGYQHTCALTGYRCFTTEGTTVVDAAHIDSWAESQNDELGNGLALSKTAHWMFDEGLWSATDDLRVVINPSRFAETGPESFRLARFAQEELRFAPHVTLRPSVLRLRSHRRKHGFDC